MGANKLQITEMTLIVSIRLAAESLQYTLALCLPRARPGPIVSIFIIIIITNIYIARSLFCNKVHTFDGVGDRMQTTTSTLSRQSSRNRLAHRPARLQHN